MPVKDEQLEYFYSVNDMNRAFDDTVGRVAAMRLPFKPTRPDKSKIKTLLDKAVKPGGGATPARFFLSLNGLKLTLEVRVGTNKMVLNTLDLGKVTDMSKRRQLMWELSERTHLITDKDLAEFDKTQADPEDEREAVELNKQIDVLKRAVDNLTIMQNAPNYKKKTYNRWDSEFRNWVERKNFGRFIGFLDDVEADRGVTGKVRALLDDTQSSGIKPATKAAIEAAIAKGEKPNLKQAEKEVTKVIEAYLLPRYNKEKLDDLAAQIKESKQKIEALTKKLKALKAD